MARATHPRALRRTAPAVPASVGDLRRAAARHLQAAGVPGPVVEAVELAVSEAVTNVVLHAYPAGADPGPVHLTVEARGPAVTVRVADEGAGIAPRLASPGAGLGLPIMTNVATTLEMSQGTRAGTELLMTFRAAAS
jgi:serine/threonine-protein kinase RsbW